MARDENQGTRGSSRTAARQIREKSTSTHWNFLAVLSLHAERGGAARARRTAHRGARPSGGRGRALGRIGKRSESISKNICDGAGRPLRRAKSSFWRLPAEPARGGVCAVEQPGRNSLGGASARFVQAGRCAG